MRIVKITYDERRAMMNAVRSGMLIVEPDHPEQFWFVGVPQLAFLVTDDLEAD